MFGGFVQPTILSLFEIKRKNQKKMPIRKGKLYYPCTKCGKKFERNSKATKLCPECYKDAHIAWRKKDEKEIV